jgi:hypothetical protein
MIHGFIRQGGLTVEETLEGLRHTLKGDFSWTDADIENWQPVAPIFGELFSLPIVHLVASSIDLSYEYSNLWQGARILTDVRPIFSKDATSIEGAVVSHTLRLYFVSSDGRHELHVAMDESDVQALVEQCERAIQKARTARDLMTDKAKVPTLISGEINNA